MVLKPQHITGSATFSVQGMHCGGCVDKLTEALRAVPGVTDAQVSLQNKSATVTTDRAVSAEQLDMAVRERGDYALRTIEATPTEPEKATASAENEADESLYPLLLIVGFLVGLVLLIAWDSGQWDWPRMMRHFMAGFFITFAFFKLLDPAGFVSAYRGYDLLARRSSLYAWAYPWIELALGVGYLLDVAPIPLNASTLAIMLLGSAGVCKALLDKRAIRCACLGTALNLPMTTVTLIEDLSMALMAAVMLILALQ